MNPASFRAGGICHNVANCLNHFAAQGSLRDMARITRKSLQTLLLAVVGVALAGCSTLMSSAARGLADNLNSAVVNLDDPDTAKAALPSYMVLLDGMLTIPTCYPPQPRCTRLTVLCSSTTSDARPG